MLKDLWSKLTGKSTSPSSEDGVVVPRSSMTLKRSQNRADDAWRRTQVFLLSKKVTLQDVLAFVTTSEHADAVEASLRSALETASHDTWVSIADARAYSQGWASHSAWKSISPDVVDDVDWAGEVWWLGLCSLHGAGYVRQRAVERLAASTSPQAVPHLVRRANDWVAPVRTLAIVALEQRLDDGDLEGFGLALAEVDQLSKQHRVDHQPLIKRIRAALLNEEHQQTHLGALKQNVCAARARAAVCWARDIDDFDLEPFIVAGAQHADTQVRLLTARLAFQRQMFTEHFDDDHSVAVRRLRFDAAVAAQDKDVVIDFLADTSRSLRADALFFVKKWKIDLDLDVVFSVAVLSQTSGRRRAAGVSGLGMIRSARLADMKHLLDDRVPRVRAAAVLALADAGLLSAEEAWTAFVDHARSVSRAACVVFAEYPALAPDVDALLGVVDDERPHVVANSLRVMLGLPRWTALRGLLLATRSESDRAFVHARLQDWLRKEQQGFIAPTTSEWAAADAARRRAHLPATLDGEVGAVLKRWRP